MTEFERTQQNYEDVKKKTEEKRIRNDEQINDIKSKVKRFKTFVWISVVAGFINFGFGLWLTHSDGDAKWREWLSSFGDYAAGTTGVLWALAGLFFVYVAFMGQQMQLLYTEIELGDNRLQMAASTLELEGQKIELREQNKHLLAQKVESSYFLTYENFQKTRQEVQFGQFQGFLAFSSISVGLRDMNSHPDPVKRFDIKDLYHVSAYVADFFRLYPSLNSYCETFNFMVNHIWCHKELINHLFKHLYYCISPYEFVTIFYWNIKNDAIKEILVESGFLDCVYSFSIADSSHLKFYKSDYQETSLDFITPIID